MWSDFTNFFRPSKMLVEKTKCADNKGFKCVYDTPKTPYQRVLEDPNVPHEVKSAIKLRRAKLSGIDIAHRVKKKLARIKRMQDQYNRAKATHNKAVLNSDMMNMIPRVAGSDAALRAAPWGTSSPRHSRNHQTEAKRTRQKCLHEPTLSVAYLANQKPLTYLSGVVSI